MNPRVRDWRKSAVLALVNVRLRNVWEMGAVLRKTGNPVDELGL